jgi:HEAT repeat protein
VLKPIDDAVVASHGDAEARKALEGRLAEVLATDAKHAAKDYVCRKLSLVGGEGCVPTVATLLTDEKLSHMGRYALERIPCDCAVDAMRDAMGKVKGKLKVGMINSLGVRRDAKATGALVGLLKDSDKDVAAAAAAALGKIGSPEAAKALQGLPLSLPVADALLACAEQLIEDGKKVDALKIYQALSKSEIKHVSLAAKRGMMAAMK